MDTGTLIVLIVVAVVVIAALLAWRWQRGRTTAPAGGSVAPAPLARSAVKTSGKLEVTAIHHGVVEGEGEWVMLVSEDYEPVQLEGWKLTDEGARHSYTFPMAIIQPGAQLRIHMWDGVNSERDVYVGRRQHWWNNDGDTAYLHDAQGTLIHSHSYGASPTKT